MFSVLNFSTHEKIDASYEKIIILTEYGAWGSVVVKALRY